VRRPIGVGHVFGQCDRITVENEGGGIARDVNFVSRSSNPPNVAAVGAPQNRNKGTALARTVARSSPILHG
jgi:hypothetical protein